MTNLGVKALLSWVNHIKLSSREINIEDIQDGTVLVKLINLLKKDPNASVGSTSEDRYRYLEEFLERDCKFSPVKGEKVHWDKIRDGCNLSIEISKVLLLLVYHDMMNDRCTLSMLECEVERELANLTGSFVLESEGTVYLGDKLESYLAKKRLPVSKEIFKSPSTCSSNASSDIWFTDEESPAFDRKRKISFVEMETVASSSVRKSPLVEIMNTPKFQVRKMQRQMIKEREYRDSLERELACTLALVSQRESQINQLQHHLDKLKKDQDDDENEIKKQISELENKNDRLKGRLNEVLKENKDLKDTSLHMERKMDELSDEKGALSSQMRAVCSQLTLFEDEVRRLTEGQASFEEKWMSKASRLEFELNQATVQKECLTEEIQILQGKISYLEDELRRATEEEAGENMGPIMERDELENEIRTLKNELERTLCSLKNAEIDVQNKCQQLSACQEEVMNYRKIIKELEESTNAAIQAKEDAIDKLKRDISEQNAIFQNLIQELHLKLEFLEREKAEQITGLEQQIATYQNEIQTLEENRKKQHELLHQTEENLQALEIKLTATTSLLADRDQEISNYLEMVESLKNEKKKIEEEIQAKEKALANLLLEKSEEKEFLNDKVQTLTSHLEELSSTLVQAKQDIQLHQNLIANKEQEYSQEKSALLEQMLTHQEEMQKLQAELQDKGTELDLFKTTNAEEVRSLETEIDNLKGQLKTLTDSLRNAEHQVHVEQAVLVQQQKDSECHSNLLLQQLSASEEVMKNLKEELQAKEEQTDLLRKQTSEQAEVQCREIQDLKQKVELLESLLREAKQNLQAKETLLEEEKLKSTRHVEELQVQVTKSQGEITRLEAEFAAKEKSLVHLRMTTATNTQSLQQEIEALKTQIKTVSDSLKIAEETIANKEDQMAKNHEKNIMQIQELEHNSSILEKEVICLKLTISKKEKEADVLKEESLREKETLALEIQGLCNNMEILSASLKSATDEAQTKEKLLTLKETELSELKDTHQNTITTCEKEIQKLTEEKLKSTRHVEELQVQVTRSQEEITRLEAELAAKEESLVQLRMETTAYAQSLQQEIEALNTQIKTVSDSLKIAEEIRTNKEDQMAKDLEKSTVKIQGLEHISSLLEKEVICLKLTISNKEKEAEVSKEESLREKEALMLRIQDLCDDMEILSASLKSATDEAQTKEKLLILKETEFSELKETHQNTIKTCEKEIQKLTEEINAKESDLCLMKEEEAKSSDSLHQEIASLKTHLSEICNTHKTAELSVQTQIAVLTKREVESAEQTELLQLWLSASEEMLKDMKTEVQKKDEEIELVKKESLKEAETLHQEINDLKGQVEHFNSSLKNAEDILRSKDSLLQEQKEQFSNQIRAIQLQVSEGQEEVMTLKANIELKEQQLNQLQAETSARAEGLLLEIHTLNTEVKTISNSLKIAEEQIKVQEDQLAKQQEENTWKLEEIQKLQESQAEKENLLHKAGDNLHSLQEQLSEMKVLMADKDENIKTLKEEVDVQSTLARKAEEECEASANDLQRMEEESFKQTEALHSEILNLKTEVVTLNKELQVKELTLQQTQQESVQQRNLLQQQILSVNEELNQNKHILASNLNIQKTMQGLQVTTLKEKELYMQEKQALTSQLVQAEVHQKALERKMEAIALEKEKLDQANLVLVRENTAYRKLESGLQTEVEMLKKEKETLLKKREKKAEYELINKDLLEQLAAKSEAAEHYKSQMEKAVDHYNGKKQLLQKSEEEVAKLQCSLEEKEQEVKTILLEKKLIQLDLDNAQANEKKLKSQMASLEAQLAYADQTLRRQNKITDAGDIATQSCFSEVSTTHSRVFTRAQVKKSLSSDSLEQSSIEDSLNHSRKLSAPDESSTPLVRTSERLAAKQRGPHAESLETLYFTPINTRQTKRFNEELDGELDSARKNLTSTAKRRRTTQVINITLTKRTPGSYESEETFCSLASARSQPNLSSAHSSRPVSIPSFDTPAGKSSGASDQLIGLPGYRRSTMHSQTASSFCVGAENEPDGGPEDWLRIAELQSRNKACLPHLKSSYPIEFETCHGGAFTFTDEELRMGDPTETIRRASMMPGQLQDSLVSHRQSLIPNQKGAAAGTRSHRFSLMPGQLQTKNNTSSQTKSLSSTSSVNLTSPEAKMRSSCFPKPLTPKNKNVNIGSSRAQLQPIPSPIERRQSMMFSIENTPNKNNYLKKRLNKLRSSTRKSPGMSSKKTPKKNSPLKGQDKTPLLNSRATVGQASRLGRLKPPQATPKGKSPKTQSKSSKSPGLTSSARKMMMRMKV